MVFRKFLPALWAALLVVQPIFAATGEDTFSIRSFEISGNQLIGSDDLQQLVAPYLGENRSLSDIQNARRDIEQAYQALGYGTVRALTPEQELTGGIVRIKVVEARIGKVTILGNKHFDQANVRASLPALQEGELPDMRRISENIQLANENPARQVEVVLSSLGNEEGALEARVLVKDGKPLRFSASLDNTGNESTGKHRLGFALQHANLFNRDHAATLAYTTSPDEPDKVDIFSLSYRLPIYVLGDSIDLIYGYSSVQSASTATVAGPLNFSGDGRVFSARYNHYFPRQGEYSSRLTLGWDYRLYENACDIGGVSCGSADADVSVRPVSLTWNGQWTGKGGSTGFYVSAIQNIPGGDKGDDADFDAVRLGADADYTVLRLGGSLIRSLASGWQWRVAASGQYAAEPLIPGEQISLAGSTIVRGFAERAIATDSGAVLNLELYSPSFATALGLKADKNLRGVVFVDAAAGSNHDIVTSAEVKHATLASAGVGLRAAWSNKASLRLDVASVLHTHPAAAEDEGDVRAHFTINVLF